MKVTAVRMGMPVIIEIVDSNAQGKDAQEVLDFFQEIDNRFSTYKKNSEVEKINRGEIVESKFSEEMKYILSESRKTKKETQGYFDVYQNGKLDPSGIVKGYAISKGADILRKMGYRNFYISIAGDIEVEGVKENKKWKVGIENPFNRAEIIKVLLLSNGGVATSGTYIRGQHIYDPVHNKSAQDTASITVIGPTAYDADRFATAAFAMGEKGIRFIDSLDGYEGYLVTKDKRGISTTGLGKYVANS